jgi:hypothetical protein
MRPNEAETFHTAGLTVGSVQTGEGNSMSRRAFCALTVLALILVLSLTVAGGNNTLYAGTNDGVWSWKP